MPQPTSNSLAVIADQSQLMSEELLPENDIRELGVEHPQVLASGRRGRVLTNSMANTFLDCPAKYYWEYVRRMSPNVPPTYFVWGGFLHFAFEMVFKGKTMEEIQDLLRAKVENDPELKKSWTAKNINLYEGYIRLLPHVVDAYLLHYKAEWASEAGPKYEVMVAEHQFSMPLIGEWLLEGKIDKIVKDAYTGAVYVWDLKTPASTGPRFWERLPLDSQMKTYLIAAQKSIGVNTTQVVYDVIKKPSAQKKPCEDPEEWADTVGAQYLVKHEDIFERGIITYEQWALDKFFLDRQQLTRQIEWAEQEGVYQEHHPGNRIGGCPYFKLCVNGENETNLVQFYQRSLSDINKELEEPTE